MLFSTPSHFLVVGLVAIGFWFIGFACHPGGRKWREMYEQEADDYTIYREDSGDRIRTADRRIAELEREKAILERDRANTTITLSDLRAGLRRERAEWDSTITDLETRLQTARAALNQSGAPPPAVRTIAPPPVLATVIATPIPAEPPPPPASRPPTSLSPPVDPVLSFLNAQIAPQPALQAAPPVSPATRIDLVEPAPGIETPAEAFMAEHPQASSSDVRSIDARVADVPRRFAAPPVARARPAPGLSGYNDLTGIRGIDCVLNTRLFGLGVTRFADLEKLSADDEMVLERRLSVPTGFIAHQQWREQAALLRAGNVLEHRARFGPPLPA